MENCREKLLRYIAYPTASREGETASPSTPEQKIFGESLVNEMRKMGISDAAIDENGYVYGSIPATPGKENVPVLAFISHMDVSPDAPCNNIQPKTILYEGGDILLQNGMVLSTKAFPELSGMKGKHLIVTSGDTLLGADDKAGIAEILSMAEHLISGNRPHGAVKICFTPDEEIGSGASLLDLNRLHADLAYTVDGDKFGSVEYETFNAAGAHVDFTGFSVHPGSGKDRLKNASLMAAYFIRKMPEKETPEHTEGREGFYLVHHMEGSVERASLDVLIRDHDRVRFFERKRFLESITEEVNKHFGKGSAEISICDSYYNMKEKIIPEHREMIDIAYEAVRMEGGEPISPPVRGGTDGACLSFRGLPCPNLGTGAGNYHSRLEYACVEDMESCRNVLLNICYLYAANGKDAENSTKEEKKA